MTCEHAGALDGVLSFAGMVLMKLKGNAPKSNRYPLYPSAARLMMSRMRGTVLYDTPISAGRSAKPVAEKCAYFVS